MNQTIGAKGLILEEKLTWEEETVSLKKLSICGNESLREERLNIGFLRYTLV